MSDAARKPLEPSAALRTAWIIWAAFAGTILIYGVVINFLAAQPEAQRRGTSEPITAAIVLAAALSGVGSVWWRRRAIRAAEARSPVGAPRAWSAESFLQACIVSWAMAETVALFGLVLSFLELDVTRYLPFGLTSLLLLSSQRPNAWPPPAGDASTGAIR